MEGGRQNEKTAEMTTLETSWLLRQNLIKLFCYYTFKKVVYFQKFVMHNFLHVHTQRYIYLV